MRIPALVMATLLLSPLAAAQGEPPRVLADKYRIDMGRVEPGASLSGTLTLSNPNAEFVEVHLAQDASSWLAFQDATLVLGPGEARALGWRASVPLDASPGHHGESVRILANQRGAPAAGTGSLAASTAIIVVARVTALGVTSIEAPTRLLPNESLAGRVLVVNTLNATAKATIVLTLLNASTGAELGRQTLATPAIPPNEQRASSFAWPGGPLPSGQYELRASLEASQGAQSAARLATPLDVGRVSGTVALTSLIDNLDGNATATIHLRNTGTLAVTLVPTVRFYPRDGGAVINRSLAPVTLAPGESRTIMADVELPAGLFRVATEGDISEAGTLQRADVPFTSFEMTRPPEASDFPVLWVLVGGFILALTAAALVILKRTAGRPRADPHDELFARLELEEPPLGGEPVAVFVDVTNLMTGERGLAADLAAVLAVCANGRPVRSAQGYVTVGSEEKTGEAWHAIESVGVQPRVAVGRPAESAILLALDLVAQASKGATLVLATHDPALAEAVRRARGKGARVEIVGIATQLPRVLREAADAVRALPAENSRRVPLAV